MWCWGLVCTAKLHALWAVSKLKLYEIQARRACNFIKFHARLKSSRPNKSLCQQNCCQHIRKNCCFLYGTSWYNFHILSYEGTHLWLRSFRIIIKCISFYQILLCQYPLTVVDHWAQHSRYKSCLPAGPTRFWRCRPHSKVVGLGPMGQRKNRTLTVSPIPQGQRNTRCCISTTNDKAQVLPPNHQLYILTLTGWPCWALLIWAACRAIRAWVDLVMSAHLCSRGS